ncbi:MAG: EamA family transporter [Chthoniobacterales bacterium]|nr:EamA family transporter [Chthoniobacterales bacterium]
MWIVYAIAASVCWGMSYAASSEILKKGFSPLLFFFGYSLFCTLGASVSLLISGALPNIWKRVDLGRADMGWFIFSIAIGALGAYLTYAAMSAKNPTLASLIEISYPFFVVLFTWVFFRLCQLNLSTMIGGLLILAGVFVIILGEH